MISEATIDEAARAAFDADHADCGREDCTPDADDLKQCERITKAVLKVFERHHLIEQLVQMGPEDDGKPDETDTAKKSAAWENFAQSWGYGATDTEAYRAFEAGWDAALEDPTNTNAWVLDFLSHPPAPKGLSLNETSVSGMDDA